MDIKFEGQFKAINSFEWLDIPPLAVLTGLNGTGKSQLLQLFNFGYNHLTRDRSNQLIQVSFGDGESYKFLFNVENFDMMPGGLINWQSQGGHFSFEQYKFGFNDLRLISEYILNNIKPDSNTGNLKNIEEFESFKKQQGSYNYVDPYPGYTRLKPFLDSNRNKIIEAIIQRSGKDKESLSLSDVAFHLPDDIISESFDIVTQDNIDMLFYLYSYRRFLLKRRNLDGSTLGESPWELLNKVIASAGLPYALTFPLEHELSLIFDEPINQLSPYQFSAKLIDPVNSTNIGINNLSSGEKIILSLALLLYYFQHRGVKKSIIILDEIDAHLHPSLTKQFFDVINNVVIKEYGARVIMATHSPSTVALAPVEKLYVIKKGQNTTAIEAVDKDKALSILTSGVPSLSINYENRRQVFVESKYDAEYYGAVYQAIKHQLIDGISIDFISAGVSGRGTCEQVIEIVEKLNGFGNKSVYGIIDWDKKNLPIGNIRILGEGLRYSIESYIFDPVLMGYYLLREKLIAKEQLELKDSDRFTEFVKFTQEQVQVIAINLLEIIKPYFKAPIDITTQDVSYANGFTIKLPNWFLQNQGHELPKIYFKAFPQLNLYKDENGLRKEIINNTIVDIPEFVSKDLILLLSSIQDLPETAERQQ